MLEVKTSNPLFKRIWEGERITYQALKFRHYLQKLDEKQTALKAQAELLLDTIEEKMWAVRRGELSSINSKKLEEVLLVAQTYLENPQDQENRHHYQEMINKLEKIPLLETVVSILGILMGIVGLPLGAAIVLGGSSLSLTGIGMPVGAFPIVVGSLMCLSSAGTLLGSGYLLFKLKKAQSERKEISNILKDIKP